MAHAQRRRFAFLTPENFDLAFERIARSRSDLEYKSFYRHLLDPYRAAVRTNSLRLIDDIQKGLYRPSPPRVFHQPKRGGGLRPRSVLAFRDLIVYQAVVNSVADALHAEQQKLAGIKRFGTLYAGAGSTYFAERWEVGYRSFTTAMTDLFESGDRVVGEFDLASYYDVIDHQLLRRRAEEHFDDETALELLFGGCLPVWTSANGLDRGHGIPQGPEASAFLAEILLFDLDELDYEGAAYLRYVDDIKLFAADRRIVDRGLLRLELRTREIGLIPQGEKIGVRFPQDAAELIKSVPSSLLAAEDSQGDQSQAELWDLLRSSVEGRGDSKTIVNETWFKYALNHLRATRRTLRFVRPFAASRPDMASLVARYLTRFGRDREAADVALLGIAIEPPYAGAVAPYLAALSQIEPPRPGRRYRRAITDSLRRTLEPQDLQLRRAAKLFEASRAGLLDAVELVSDEGDPLLKGQLLDALFLSDTAPFKPAAVRQVLRGLLNDQDPELAQFAAAQLIQHWDDFTSSDWKPPRKMNESVRDLLYSVGLRGRRGNRSSVTEHFFRQELNVSANWRQVFAADFAEMERACSYFLLQRHPVLRLLALDGLNDVLSQSFAKVHPGLSAEFSKMRGTKTHPSFTRWLSKSSFRTVAPVTATWFTNVNDLRNRHRAAHPRSFEKRRQTDDFTYADFERLYRRHRQAWYELLTRWPKGAIRLTPATQPVGRARSGSAAVSQTVRAASA
ncbi:MAG: hypothetical protein Q7K37_07435 [Dehalococcoidia bacterium]|nr:hypothetical protein [Dehalococcoidia bacterium]